MTAATIEPTPEQLAVIATLEPRVRAVFLEVAAISYEIDDLRKAGLETREAATAVVWVDSDALDELRELRICSGIPAFSEWWFNRIRVLWPLEAIVAGVPADDMGGDAMLARQEYKAALAVEQAIAQADPELIRLLDLAARREFGEIDQAKLEAAIGMTNEQLEDRAEDVLTQLIASGWRPPTG